VKSVSDKIAAFSCRLANQLSPARVDLIAVVTERSVLATLRGAQQSLPLLGCWGEHCTDGRKLKK
jgi:hypothetical protein